MSSDHGSIPEDLCGVADAAETEEQVRVMICMNLSGIIRRTAEVRQGRDSFPYARNAGLYRSAVLIMRCDTPDSIQAFYRPCQMLRKNTLHCAASLKFPGKPHFGGGRIILP